MFQNNICTFLRMQVRGNCVKYSQIFSEPPSICIIHHNSENDEGKNADRFPQSLTQFISGMLFKLRRGS